MASRRNFTENCDSPSVAAVRVRLWPGQHTERGPTAPNGVGGQQQTQGDTLTSSPSTAHHNAGNQRLLMPNARRVGNTTLLAPNTATAQGPIPFHVPNPRGAEQFAQAQSVSDMNSSLNGPESLPRPYRASRQGNATTPGSSRAYQQGQIQNFRPGLGRPQPQLMVANDFNTTDEFPMQTGYSSTFNTMMLVGPSIPYPPQTLQIVAATKPTPPTYPIIALGNGNQSRILEAMSDPTSLRTTIGWSAAMRLGLTIHIVPPGRHEPIMNVAGPITVHYLALKVLLKSSMSDNFTTTASIVVLPFDFAGADIIVSPTLDAKLRQQPPVFTYQHPQEIVDDFNLQQQDIPISMMSAGTTNLAYPGPWPSVTPDNSLRPPTAPRSHISANLSGTVSPISTHQSVPVSSAPTSLSTRPTSCYVHSSKPAQALSPTPNFPAGLNYDTNIPQNYSRGQFFQAHQTADSSQPGQSYFGHHSQPTQEPWVDQNGLPPDQGADMPDPSL